MKARCTLLSAFFLPAFIFMFAFQHSAHAQYCASAASNTSDEWISNVTFAGINNNSGSTTYTNYTAISASVNPGQSYPISVTITNGTTIQWTETVRVWVDWNQDFTFSPDEQYNVGSMPVPGGASVVFNTSIPVPAGATAGPTRMRVTLRFSTYAGPCDSFTFGEVEDYTVTVSGGDPDPDPDPEAPANDLCSTAIAVTCGSTVTGTTDGASANEVPSCNLVFPGQGVWYSLVGNGGTITLSTCSSNTNFDTQIGVFSGSCTSLSCVAGNNNDTGCANSRQSTVSFPSTAGTTYYIYVTGVLGAHGDFQLSIACTPPPIVNDNCSGALPIACGQTVTGSTTGALADAVSFCGTSLSTAPGVWYTITGTGGSITLTTCNAGTNYDTKLGVFRGACGGLICVAGNDDATCALGFGRSTVTFASTSGTTYYILVTGFSTANGNFALSATCPIVPPNNTCAGAVAVSCGQTVSGTTVGATINPPVTTCGTTIGTSGGVWYSVAGTGFDITVTTCNPGTNYDTKLAVFSGSCGSLTCVGGNDDGSPGGGQDPACFTVPGVNVNRASTFTFASTAGVTYYVYVTGFGTNTGNHQLSVICEEPPPVSPNCENATPVFCGDFIQASTSGGQINNFGSSCGTSQSANISTAPGVWYQFTATNNFLVTLNTCFPATDFDSKLAVFSGSCGDLTCVAVNDNAGGNCSVLFGRPAAVTFEAFAGNTYYIYVTGHQGANGNFAMSVSCSVLNDLCANALPIECGEAVTGNTTGATSDAVPFCGTSLNTAPGVWYTFVGNGLELTLETCAPTGFDTKLGVFEGTCGALQCVAGNDDACGLRSRVTFDSEDGVTYYVLVTGFGSANGAFILNFVGNCGAPPPPGNNDFCDGATLVSCGSVVTGTTTDATAGAVPTCGTTLSSAPGRWYRFVGTGEQVVATTCNPGSNYDTKLGVFSGTCGGLVCVTGNDDSSCSFSGLRSTVSWLSTPGVNYYIYVTGFGTATGNYELSFTCTPGPANACSNAPFIVCGDLLTGSTVGAPVNSIPTCVTTLNTAPGVWYRFTGIGDNVTITTCNAGSNYDTKLGVFTGSCSSLVCVTGNDDSPCPFSGLRSTVTFAALSGTEYYIYVTGFSTAAGTYQISVTCSTTLVDNTNTLAVDMNPTQLNASELAGKENPLIGNFYPNPAQYGNTNVQIFATTEGEAGIRIFDNVGRLAHNTEVELYSGVNTVSLQLGNLPAGTYFATINVEGVIFKKKLIIAQ